MLRRMLLACACVASYAAAACAQTDVYRQIVIPGALKLEPLYRHDLAPVRYSSKHVAPGVRVERVSYTTQFGMRVPAIVYTPEKIIGKAPAIIVVPGHGGDKSSWYAVYTGLLYASAGAVVLTYDPAGEFERNPARQSETRLHDEPTGLEHPERVGGLMVQDAIRGVDYLRSRPDVDPARIAMLGYSMGTFHAALAAAEVYPGVRALLLSAGGNLDGPGQYWDSGNKINCQAGPYKALLSGALSNDDRGVEIYSLIAASAHTLVMNGSKDALITKFNEQEPWFEALRQRMLAKNSSYFSSSPDARDRLPETFFDPEAGHRPAFAERRAALWLHHQLHFPNWTDAEINALPLTTAHAWASTHGVRIAAQYDNTEQEGGVPILDLHLPGLTRQQLTAVPEAEWQRDKASYTFDAWLPHAHAAERASTHLPTPAASIQSKHP